MRALAVLIGPCGIEIEDPAGCSADIWVLIGPCGIEIK